MNKLHLLIGVALIMIFAAAPASAGSIFDGPQVPWGTSVIAGKTVTVLEDGKGCQLDRALQDGSTTLNADGSYTVCLAVTDHLLATWGHEKALHLVCDVDHTKARYVACAFGTCIEPAKTSLSGDILAVKSSCAAIHPGDGLHFTALGELVVVPGRAADLRAW